MGRRSFDAEGDGSRLGEDDAGKIAKLAADLLDQGPACFLVRLTPFMANPEERFDARCRLADKPSRTPIETALPRVACNVPGFSDLIVEIITRAVTEAAVDQAQCMSDARQARYRLGIIEPFVVLRLRD